MAAVIFGFIIIGYFIYMSKQPKKEKKHSDTIVSEKEGVREISQYGKGEIPNYGKGRLLESCPCSSGFECSADDGNICKVKDDNSCNVKNNNDCVASSFCFDGICTPKPMLQDTYHLDVRNTPMLLENNRFVVPKTWWGLNDVTSICPLIKQNTKDKQYYVITNGGRIYRTDLSTNAANRVEIPRTTKINHLFSYENEYYAIGDHFLYKLVDENKSVWNFSKINRFFNKDIIGIEMLDATVVEDRLVLTTTDGILSYQKGYKELNDDTDKGQWTKTDYIKIKYGADLNRFIVQDGNDRIEYHEVDGLSKDKVRRLEGDIIDFELSKSDPHVIYVLNRNNVCYEYRYDSNGGIEDSSVKLMGSIKRIMSEGSSIWGISTARTYDFSRA